MKSWIIREKKISVGDEENPMEYLISRY